MQTYTPEHRQIVLACGRLVPLDGARGRMPDSNSTRLGFKGFADAHGPEGGAPTTCPTYTTALPEVIEIARASRWKDNLVTFIGAKPSEVVVDLIDIYDAEQARFERWAMTPDKDGGGADTRRGT